VVFFVPVPVPPRATGGATRLPQGTPERLQGQEATEKKPRENKVHLRQLAKKKRKYVRFFKYTVVRFWTFLSKGSSKTRGKKIVRYQNINQGNMFSGDDFFSGGNFFFFLSIFVCALVKRLSVKGNEKTRFFFYGSCV
jgi:hypothetical protein